MNKEEVYILAYAVELLTSYENILKEKTKQVQATCDDKEWVDFVEKSNRNRLGEIEHCKNGLNYLMNKFD